MDPELGSAPLEAWPIPDGVMIAPGIDLASPDPAAVEGSRRTCTAVTKKGARCSAPALKDSIFCTPHAGRINQSAGGQARAAQLRLVRDEAENRMVEARMGARSIIAARAIERADDLRRAFDVVLDGTMAGDKTQARNLLGYLQAAFPDVSTGDNAQPTPGDDLTTLTTSELRALAHPSS